MLRTTRRKLREIRYYSASQKQTVWTAAADAALLAAIILAVPATWLTDRLVMRSETMVTIVGSLVRNVDDGRYRAIVDRTVPQQLDWERLANLGRFTVTIDEQSRGWPFTTTVARQAAVVSLDLFSEPQPRIDVQLDPEDPLRLAIEAGLAESDETATMVTLRDGPPPPRPVLLNWLTAIGVWWIMLSFGLVACVRLLQFVAMRAGARRQRRRLGRLATGHCASCGYNLRGLEFNERCPECGVLVE